MKQKLGNFIDYLKENMDPFYVFLISIIHFITVIIICKLFPESLLLITVTILLYLLILIIASILMEENQFTCTIPTIFLLLDIVLYACFIIRLLLNH